MELYEAEPLPEECQTCTEPECDVCEHGSERWNMSQTYRQLMVIKMKVMNICRSAEEIKEQINVLQTLISEQERIAREDK